MVWPNESLARPDMTGVSQKSWCTSWWSPDPSHESILGQCITVWVPRQRIEDQHVVVRIPREAMSPAHVDKLLRAEVLLVLCKLTKFIIEASSLSSIIKFLTKFFQVHAVSHAEDQRQKANQHSGTTCDSSKRREKSTSVIVAESANQCAADENEEDAKECHSPERLDVDPHRESVPSHGFLHERHVVDDYDKREESQVEELDAIN